MRHTDHDDHDNDHDNDDNDHPPRHDHDGSADDHDDDRSDYDDHDDDHNGAADHDDDHNGAADHDDDHDDNQLRRITASMTEHHLLDIQRLDTEAEQLRHRHANLEQRAQLEAARAEAARIEAESAAIDVSRLEVAARQKRFEDEAQIFSAKADDDDKRLYSGDVGMKDLEPLQAEIAGLRERQGDLEDKALEAMEEAEALAVRRADADERAAAIVEAITVAEAELASAEAEIAAQLVEVAAQREAAAAAVDPGDLAEYERLRPGMGSATVVRFDGGNCVGCPSTMPAVELDRMKHADAGSVLSCSECGRIVIT
jgi:uncharacterized protein